MGKVLGGRRAVDGGATRRDIIKKRLAVLNAGGLIVGNSDMECKYWRQINVTGTFSTETKKV